ncbi:MAG TPA: hypothetical protein RMG48_13305 [Myxococcales bacterium LLY-WYZ-16_1]|nr:hypothetical protein [Myxococcales bacterium LLY-WYZ-16_1]
MSRRGSEPAGAGGLGEDPLSADELLQERFFGPAPAPAGRRPAAKEKPSHYRVISISLYEEDFARLEAMVAELKRRGHTKANKSQLIRFALRQVDLDEVPPGL